MLITKINDYKTIRLAINGNADAFERLAEEYYMMVYRISYKWCGVRENAEDITQEVFIKLARNIGNFREDSSFKTWLYRITINTAKDFYKKNARKNEVPFIHEDVMVSQDKTQEEEVLSREIYKAIDKLSVKLKEAVLLVCSEEMSHQEAAKILGCTEATVSWRIFQAKKKLKKILGGEL